MPHHSAGLRHHHDLRGNRPSARAGYLWRHPEPKEVVMTASTSTTFLRRALLLDAAASSLTGALMIGGARLLADLLALPAGLLRGAGLILVPYVAFVVMVASRTPISVRAVWAVIACNGLWAVASVAIVVN